MYISYANPKQTKQDRYQEEADKGQRIKKVTKVNESKQYMEGGLQEEPVKHQTLMPSPQLTQQVASIGTSPMHTSPSHCYDITTCSYVML